MVKKRKVRGYRTTWEGFLNLGVLSVGLRKLRNSLRTTGQELALPPPLPIPQPPRHSLKYISAKAAPAAGVT